MHVEVARSAAASAEDVWALLVDVERWPTVTRSMRQVRLLTEGPLALGSRVRLRRPHLAPLTWVVTSLDAGRAFTWRSTSGGVVTEATHEVIPGPAGTSTIRLSIDQTGAFAAPVSVLFRGLAKRYLRLEAEGLAAAAGG
jgi:uncharacterized membrane protein